MKYTFGYDRKIFRSREFETIAPRAGYGNLALIRTLGNQVNLRGLPGGAEGIQTAMLLPTPLENGAIACVVLSGLARHGQSAVGSCVSAGIQTDRRWLKPFLQSYWLPSTGLDQVITMSHTL
jgi:hypothetical protein